MNNIQPFNQLKTGTIKDYLIFLDIDGTLIEDSEIEVDKEGIKKINELKKHNQIYLCPNGPDRKRNRAVAELCKLDYLDTDIKKPSKKILNLIDIQSPDKKLVIGDKFLTDGLFAKRIKADFIKVKRITSKNDKLYIKFLYWIDDLIYKII